jgi:hypothetical protein
MSAASLKAACCLAAATIDAHTIVLIADFTVGFRAMPAAGRKGACRLAAASISAQSSSTSGNITVIIFSAMICVDISLACAIRHLDAVVTPLKALFACDQPSPGVVWHRAISSWSSGWLTSEKHHTSSWWVTTAHNSDQSNTVHWATRSRQHLSCCGFWQIGHRVRANEPSQL